MPRSLEFDPDEVLEKAMYAFWEKGVEHTSVSDLVDATGVQRSGLYNVFGNKERLFKKALERYLKNVVTVNFGRYFDKPDTDIEDLKIYFENFNNLRKNPMSFNGCLMCNTASSKSLEAQLVSENIARMFSEIKAYFRAALRNSRTKKLISTSASDKHIAEALLGSVIALSTMCRSPNGRPLVKSYVAQLVDQLNAL